MSANFDPYHQWLGIPPDEQPAHLYRLLGLSACEASLDVIEHAADQKMLHLRTFQTGKHVAASQQLLNEIAAAKTTLLDPQKKAAYDAKLKAKLQPAKRVNHDQAALPVAKSLPTKSPTIVSLPSAHVPAATRNRRSSASRSYLYILVGGAAVILVAAVVFAMQSGQEVATVVPPPAKPSEPSSPPQSNEVEKPAAPPAPVPTPATPQPPATDVLATKPTKPPETSDEPAPGDKVVAAPEPTARPMVEEPTTEPQPARPDPIVEAAATESAAPPEKQPVPDKTIREAKRTEVLMLFPPTKARTFEEKGQLAEQLIATANETKGDHAARFALLNLAREQAAEAGQVRLAFKAIDELEKIFDFDASGVRVTSFVQASKAMVPQDSKRELVDAGVELVNELVAQEKFEDTGNVCDRTLALARTLRNAELIQSITEQRRLVDDVAANFKRASAALETLKTKPDNADAHAVVGRYLAFIKQDWEAGLEHLAKGSDKPLAAAATSELAKPGTPAEQETLADAWWLAGEAQKATWAKAQCRARASYWYHNIVGDLTGLPKVKVEKRIAEAESTPAPPSRGKKQEWEITYLDDIQEAAFSAVGDGGLGKHGDSHQQRKSTVFLGKVPDHALGISGTSNGITSITYDLDGTYETFSAIAALWKWSDGKGGDKSVTPLTFRVLGDGKVLWTSVPLQMKDTAQELKVGIRNVRKLVLELHCPGSNEQAVAVWINPQIVRLKRAADTKKAPETPEALATAKTGDEVYLDDLNEVDFKVGIGSLGKHGAGGHPSNPPWRFLGRLPEHALSMHGTDKGTVYATYQLDREFATFEAVAALWEATDREAQVAASPLVFKVVGDDKVLWQSGALQKGGTGQNCRVNVKGVKTLRLEVACPGDKVHAHCVWVNPRLLPIHSAAKK